MNCLECREMLQKRLDGALLAAPALEQHLSDCAACREQHAGAVRLLDVMQHLPQPTLPVGFAAAMVAQVMEDRLQRQRKMRRRVFATLALAASVVLMLLAAYNWLPRSNPEDPQPKPPIVEDGPKKDVPRPRKPDEPKIDKKDEPRNAVAALADRWAGTTRDHAKVLQAAAHVDGVDNLPPVPMNPGVREASQDVSDGVMTVTRNARKAFDYFARELPMPELEEQKN